MLLKRLIMILIALTLMPLPVHAQNGDQLVYVVARASTDGSFDLYRLSQDGSEEVLLDTGGLDYGSVQLSADQSRFFYLKQVDADHRQLWTATFDGSIARGLGDPFDMVLLASYEISPTAEHVLFFTLDLTDETRTRALINVQSGTSSSAPSSGIIHFSHDGRYIRYGYTGGGTELRWTAARRRVIPGSSEEVVFSETVDAQSAMMNVIPVPDSDTYIVFIMIVIPKSGGTLGERFMYLVGADGSLTQLKHGSSGLNFFEYAETRIYDGTQYVIYREAPNNNLMAVNLTTGENRSLSDGDAIFLDASPDLTHVVYRDHVSGDTEGPERIRGVYYKDANSDPVEIVRDYTVNGHIINDQYAGFYNNGDDAPAGWDIYRVWDVQAGEPVLLLENVDAATRLFANDVNDLLILAHGGRDEQALKLVIYDGTTMAEIMTIDVLDPGGVTMNAQHGIVAFVSHEDPDRVFLLDLTRDDLVPYIFTEGSQVWSFSLDE